MTAAAPRDGAAGAVVGAVVGDRGPEGTPGGAGGEGSTGGAGAEDAPGAEAGGAPGDAGAEDAPGVEVGADRASGGPVVVLVGAPGAGKTTVGTMVAAALGVTFVDTDALVEADVGQPIADLFIDAGEAHFRRLEAAAVAAALAGPEPKVLALGGGAVLDPATRARLAGHRVVLLDVGLADAAARVGLNRDRPLLLGNPRGQLRRLLEERRPVYAEVAVATVRTDGRTPDEVAADVLALLREPGP